MQDEVVITVIATGFEGRPVSKNDTDTVNHFGRSAQEKGQRLGGAFTGDPDEKEPDEMFQIPPFLK